MEKVRGRGNSPNTRKALMPGQVKKGGPAKPGAGRPVGSLSLKDRIAKFSGIEIKVKMPSGTIENQTIMDSIVLTLLAQAQKGNMVAVKEVFDRMFGKEPEKTNDDLQKTLDDIKISSQKLNPHAKEY